MKKEMICIICPHGCQIELTQEGNALSVKGNACPRGAEYAKSELLDPRRTLTATVRVSNRKDTMVSVKTEHPIPKSQMMNIMKRLRDVHVNAPIAIGDILLPDVWGTKVIATQKVD